MSSFRIKTLGCRLNQAESATMAGGLERLGFTLADDDSVPCDVYVLHTCAITHAAELEAVRLMRHARRALGPSAFLVATGCAVEVPGAADAFRDAGADLVVRQCDKSILPDLISQARPAPHTAWPDMGIPKFTTTRAILKVQDGCGFRCSYCIVPDTRGAPRSRPFEEVVSEADAVFRAGYREIVLAGVNIACYRDRGRSLRALVEALLALPSRAGGRLRLGSIEPATTERELLDLAASESGLCRFFHFPLQSGSDRILRAMRRHYTAAEYEATLDAALERMPDACLGADIITGFPGETDEDFAATRALVERHPFGNLHVFPYSERPGTPAATMPDSVPVAVRRTRARELIELADATRAAFAERFAGREVEALIERVSPDGIGTGWSGEYLECRISGCTPADVNTLRPMRVDSVRETILHGRFSAAVANSAPPVP